MDRLIVERKLDSLHRCITRIASKQPATAESLEADVDLQDILVLNLSRAVQLCVDMATHVLIDLELPPPDTMGEAFDQLAQAEIIDQNLALQMKKDVRLRNNALRAYDKINSQIAFATATRFLHNSEDFAKVIATLSL